MKAFSTTVSFFYSQLLHMISPFFMQLVQRALVKSSAVMIHCLEVAWRQDVVPATQCVTADST